MDNIIEEGKVNVLRGVGQSAPLGHVLAMLGLFESFTETEEAFYGRCPLGEEQHGTQRSLVITKKNKLYRCRACKRHGTMVDFVAQVKKLSLILGACYMKDHILDVGVEFDRNSAVIPFTKALEAVRWCLIDKDDLIVLYKPALNKLSKDDS